MKKLLFSLVLVLGLFMMAGCEPKNEDPDDDDDEVTLDVALDSAWLNYVSGKEVYLTTVGQADVDIVENIMLMAEIDEADYTKEALLQASAVPEGAVVLLVTGSSAKGLGAAGTDVNAENVRAQAFATRASNDQITLITLHVGGAARRGSLSDNIITSACSPTDLILVVTSGNQDKFFNGLAGTTVPLHEYSTAGKVIDAFKTLFGK